MIWIDRKLIDSLEFDGHHARGQNFDKIFVHGNGPDLFLAVGCSWTRAWGAHDYCLAFGDDQFRDDREFMLNKSYAGRLANHLGFGGFINMAIPGSSIDLQVRFAVEFLQKNRQKFNRVFVLWGITSHLRWELYGNVVNKPTMFQFGTEVPEGKRREMDWYLKYHWNENFEIERYSQKIVMFHCYLKSLNVEHLFFPVFESFNSHNMNLSNLDEINFFNQNDKINDMLGLWCQDHGLDRPSQLSSNPFSSHDVYKLKDLSDIGYLSKKFAHPTEQGHRDIFCRLSEYLTQHV